MQEHNDVLEKKIKTALMSIRPYLQADGGDLEYVDVSDDGIVSLKLTGACRGCPGAQMTLQMGVERVLKQQVPEVKGVRAV